MKFKLAVFRDVKRGTDTVFTCYRDDQNEFAGDIRISSIVEVDIPLLPPAETAARQISELDRNIAAVTEEFARQLDSLQSRKAELLAITCQSEPA